MAYAKTSYKNILYNKIARFIGGDEEDRTLDLTDANRTLSQLSYAPKIVIGYMTKGIIRLIFDDAKAIDILIKSGIIERVQ